MERSLLVRWRVPATVARMVVEEGGPVVVVP